MARNSICGISTIKIMTMAGFEPAIPTKSGWHDNGGYVPDSDEKKQSTGSWLK